VNRDLYLQFLKLVHDAKTAPGFTNIELNFFNGLQDPATLTELTVLALYAQAIGRPYMIHVRSVIENALELGNFHERVKNHCRAIIEEPDLLLGSDASPQTGALEGQTWDRPDLVYHAVRIAGTLPHLREMLVAFFRGALKTWERFTSEFAPEGPISKATPAQRSSVWNCATNDASEGALGQCRQMLRRAPFMTDNQRNARVMWKQNGTYVFAKTILSEQDQQFVRKEARSVDSSAAAQKTRLEQNRAWEDRAESNKEKQIRTGARKAATKHRLATVKILDGATYGELMRLKVSALDEQIDKLRETGDGEVRAKSTIGNKKAKVEEIVRALNRRRSQGASADSAFEDDWSDKGDAEMSVAQSEEEENQDEDMGYDPDWDY
jgi:hypothetical protein